MSLRLEVKTSLNNYLLSYYSYSSGDATRHRLRLIEALQKKEINNIRDIMQSHFASIPNDWYRKNDIDSYEGYYASVFYSYFASLGVDVRPEDTTNYGKIDMTVIMPHAVLILEFRVIKPKDKVGNALQQIKEKGYADKYRSLNLPISLVGLEFDKSKRNIRHFQWEKCIFNKGG